MKKSSKKVSKPNNTSNFVTKKTWASIWGK